MVLVVLNEVNLDVGKWYVFQISRRSLAPSKVVAFSWKILLNRIPSKIRWFGRMVVFCVWGTRDLHYICSFVTAFKLKRWILHTDTRKLDEGYESVGTQVLENVDDEVLVDN